MKKVFGKNILPILIALMLICSVSAPAFAINAEADNDRNRYSAFTENVDENSSDASKVVPTRAYKSVYSNTETLIYIGNGSDRWLHITPWVTPNYLQIRMVDYQGNTVWLQYFTATDTTHWFVGSNVRYVYLMGVPGGVVEVRDTEH